MQRVFDHTQRKVVPLHPIPESTHEELQFLHNFFKKQTEKQDIEGGERKEDKVLLSSRFQADMKATDFLGP